MSEDKGHAPTKKKLDQARKDGKVLKSPLLTGAVGWSFGAGVALWLCGSVWVDCQILLQSLSVPGGYGNGDWLVIGPQIRELFASGLWLTVRASLSVLLVVVLVSLAIGFAQSGLKFEPGVIKLDLSKLNPSAGMKRVFSSFPELVATTIRVGVVLLVFGTVLYCWYPQFVALGAASERDVVDVFSALAHSAVYIGAALLLLFGAVDYLLQRRKFYRELSMSLDDLRREHKEDEGDPHIRSARKHMHQTLSNEDITARVRRSKVIVVESRDSK